MKIEANISERIETGPLQINDDWPGIFIRGDNAMYMGFVIKEFLEGTAQNDIVAKMYLEQLAEILSGCRAQILDADESFTLVIKGFKSKEEVEAFYSWYESQGGQDAPIWFENIEGIREYMNTDTEYGFKFDELNKTGYMKIEE